MSLHEFLDDLRGEPRDWARAALGALLLYACMFWGCL